MHKATRTTTTTKILSRSKEIIKIYDQKETKQKQSRQRYHSHKKKFIDQCH